MFVRIDGIATLGQIEINVADGEDKDEEEEPVGDNVKYTALN
jgi:hypothetical protein